MVRPAPRRDRPAIVGQPPDVRVASAGAGFEAIGFAFFSAGRLALKMDTEAKIQDAERRGAQAGMEGEIETQHGKVPAALLSDDRGPAAESYNRAVLVNYRNRMDTMIRQKTGELSRQYATDPVALEQNGVEFWKSVRSTVPALMQGDLDRTFSTMLDADLDKARVARFKIFQDQAKADVYTTEREVVGRAVDAAGNLLSDDPGARDRATLLVSQEIDRLQRLYEQTDPSGAPIFSEFEKVKMRTEIATRVFESSVLASFDRAPDKLKMLQTFHEGGLAMAGPNSPVTAEDVAKIEGKMYQRLNQQISLEDKLIARHEKAIERTQKANADAMMIDIVQPETTLTPREIDERFLRGDIDATQRNTLHKMRADPAVADDAQTVHTLETSVYEDNFMDQLTGAYAAKQITRDTFVRLTQKRVSTEQSGGILNSNPVRRQRSFLESGFGKNGPFDSGFMDPAKKVRLGEAVREFDDRVEAGEDARAVADELRKRELTRREVVQPTPGLQPFWKSSAGKADKASTEAAIAAALKSNDITLEQARDLLKELDGLIQ